MIEAILNERYGVGVLAADPIAIIWAAEWITVTEQAKAELKRVNALQRKYGKVPAYPAFGTRLFGNSQNV
jgi:hypothetical protein